MIEDCGKRGNTMAERRQLFAEMREYFLEMFCCDRPSQLLCNVSKIYTSFPPQISIAQMNIMRPKLHENGLIWPKQERGIFYVRFFDWIILISSFLREKWWNTQVAMKRDKGLQKLHLFLEISVVGCPQPAAKLSHTCLIPSGMGENTGRAEASKFITWDKDLIRWQKEREKFTTETKNQWCRSGYSHFPKADWCLASHRTVSVLEDKTPHPLLSLPQFYCWAWHYMMWTNLLGRWSHPSLLCLLSASCSFPDDPGREQSRKQKSLGAVQALFSSSWNSAVLSTLLATDLKHSTMQNAVKKVNCISARHSTGTHVLHTPLQCNFL